MISFRGAIGARPAHCASYSFGALHPWLVLPWVQTNVQNLELRFAIWLFVVLGEDSHL